MVNDMQVYTERPYLQGRKEQNRCLSPLHLTCHTLAGPGHAYEGRLPSFTAADIPAQLPNEVHQAAPWKTLPALSAYHTIAASNESIPCTLHPSQRAGPPPSSAQVGLVLPAVATLRSPSSLPAHTEPPGPLLDSVVSHAQPGVPPRWHPHLHVRDCTHALSISAAGECISICIQRCTGISARICWH